MHILQVTPRYFPSMGGVEELVKKISEMLVDEGFNVTVYSIDLKSGTQKKQKINGVLVKRFNSLVGDPLYFPEPSFISELRKENVDIIHVHNMHTSLPLVVALSKKRRHRILLQPHYHRFGQSHLRDSLFKFYKRSLARIVFSSTDVVIANSLYEKRILCEDFSLSGKLVLIPEGIDVEECKNVKHAPTEPKKILYVGTLRSYKNVDKLINAFAYLMRNEREKFRLVIVGEGPEHPHLVNLAHELGVADFVKWRFRLTRQQLLSEYAQASAFVHLSPLESFSRVVYEALLIGVPTVVLNFGATEHLVKGGVAEGVNSVNPKEIGTAILKAINGFSPKVSCSSLVSDWKEYFARLVKLYYNLLI
ncbi:MAG: glycosyltransferase family 4 protein [Candidatus Bathycorpusculaceae bacterium]